MKHAIFLLASLAFASATTTTTTTTDEHSLRGGGGLASRRSLQDVPLVVGPGPGLGPGESNCYLHPDGDGTVECTIRSQFSAYDPIYSKNPTTSLGCVTDPEKGYQYCANIGLNLQADPNGILPPPPGIMGSAASGGGGSGGGGGSVPSTGGVWTGSGSITGSCPRSQPTPGSHCSGWIPEGASESSCLFGAVQCNCAGQGGDANTIGWSCRDLSAGGSGNVITTPITVTPGVSFPITVPAPAPVPVPVPVPVIPEPVVVGNIDAEISNAIVPPPRTEQVSINMAPNNALCPITRPNGADCSWREFSGQCAYVDTESPTGWVRCGCTKDDDPPGWRCRNYVFEGFSF